MMKNIKLVTKLSLAIALMTTSMISIGAVDNNDDEKDVQKQETVYAFLDENGTFQSATVSEWLHSDNGFDNVEDTSTLKDIKNLKGDETPTVNGTTLIWNSDNDDIYYQGTSNEQLPVNMEVSYYFNGEKVDINDVVGESGKLEIHIKLVNSLEKTETINGVKKHISTLFPCIILTDLKDDIFKDVKADDAIVVNEAKNQVVSFVTVSGASEMLNDSDIDALDDIKDKLKDEFIISANVENLEMPSIFMAISGMVEIDHDDINADDLDELKDGLNDLQDAMNEILTGSDDLYDAVSGDLTSGVSDLDQGAADLKDGAKKLADGSSKLQSEGIAQIKDGTASLLSGSQTLQSGIEQLTGGVSTLANNSDTLRNGSASVMTGLTQLYNVLSGIDVNNLPSSETISQLSSSSNTILSSIQTIKETMEANLPSSDTLAALQSNVDALKGSNSAVATQFTALIESGAYSEASELFQNAVTLLNTNNDTLDQLVGTISSTSSSLSSLYSAICDLYTGYSQFNSAIQGASSSFSMVGQLPALITGINTLYTSYGDLNDGIISYTQGVDAINSNMAELANGSKTLTAGISSLNDGITTIYSSTNELVKGSKELYDGTVDLKDGTSELKDGVSDLNDGVSELRDGLYEFNQEGIEELNSKVNDAIDDLDDVLDTVNATLDQSVEYNNYAGTNDNMESSVKFIMKTSEVKVSQEKETTDTQTSTDTVSSSTTLWQRIVNLFK